MSVTIAILIFFSVLVVLPLSLLELLTRRRSHRPR